MNFDTISQLLKYGLATQHNLRGAAPSSFAEFSPQGIDFGPGQDIASHMTRLAGAMYTPDDPIYQQIYGQEREAATQDLAGAIAEMSRQNRKLSMMGRTPLFNPERGGEMLFRTMTQGYQDAQHKARTRARDILGVGQQALGRAYGAYDTSTARKLGLRGLQREEAEFAQGQLNQRTQQQQADREQRLSGKLTLANMLPILGRFF